MRPPSSTSFSSRVLAPIARGRSARSRQSIRGAAARSAPRRIWSVVFISPDAPFEALPAAQDRAEIDQQRDERARLQAAEALVDRRLERAVDAHRPGDEQRHGRAATPSRRRRCRHSARMMRDDVPLEGERQEGESATRAARTSSGTGRARRRRNRSPAGATAAARSRDRHRCGRATSPGRTG